MRDNTMEKSDISHIQMKQARKAMVNLNLAEDELRKTLLLLEKANTDTCMIVRDLDPLMHKELFLERIAKVIDMVDDSGAGLRTVKARVKNGDL